MDNSIKNLHFVPSYDTGVSQSKNTPEEVIELCLKAYKDQDGTYCNSERK